MIILHTTNVKMTNLTDEDKVDSKKIFKKLILTYLLKLLLN